MGRLRGKTAIVTGAASGIGAATARRMAEEGASVVVADINMPGAESVADSIAEAGGRATAFCVDVLEEKQIVAMVQSAIDAFGRLDVMFNNAGAAAKGKDVRVADLDVAIWDWTMALNARGVMLGCKHAIPEMLKVGGGSIINTASLAGVLGKPDRTAYGASKAAVLTLTRYVATQHGADNIRCNAIVPGLILTPASLGSLSTDLMQRVRGATLLPFAGEPDDIASTAIFLACEESRYITGQEIWVDGGTSARSQVEVPTRRD